MNWKVIYILPLAIVFACEVKTESNKEHPVKIDDISVLISRGGREIPLEEADKFIPDSLSDEMYLFDIDTLGELKVSYGFGSFTETDVNIMQIESSNSITIAKDSLANIFRLATRIYKDNEYQTQQSMYDSWIAKLKINNKVYTYYFGESLDTLTLDYLYLIDKIVSVSPIKVKYYRN